MIVPQARVDVVADHPNVFNRRLALDDQAIEAIALHDCPSQLQVLSDQARPCIVGEHAILNDEKSGGADPDAAKPIVIEIAVDNRHIEKPHLPRAMM